MCGIAGIVTADGLRSDDAGRLDAMLRAIAHRGPDDQHIASDGHAAIGARRLSIIDLATGRQPLTDESGTILASQNGELYEYVELREELQAAGHTLRSTGDTEIIPHLYEEHGDRFVDRLAGMFAIALWDGRRRRLVLARDRLGKKPIYYRVDGGRLLYGSELKALMADDDLERSVDPAALSQYLRYGYVPGEGTILRGVRKLRPASVLTWERGRIAIRRYWEPVYGPKRQQSFDEDVEACLALVRNAVRLRLRSDVPVGAFLSGGIDSSLVVALAAEQSAAPLRTFSIGFEEQGYNELPFAREVANRFGTVHDEEVVRIDAAGALMGLAHAFDEPLADTSTLPTYRIAELAGRQLKVVLTGDGGDEAFAGYRTYRRQVLMDRVGRLVGPLQPSIADLMAAALGATGAAPGRRSQLERWARDARLSPDARFLNMMTLTQPPVRDTLLGGDGHDPDAILVAALRAGPRDVVDRLLRADTLVYLPDDLLVKMDRATMAWSLEARSPLLDHRLVEFAALLPADRKVRPMQTKVLLRAVSAKVLPPEITSRPKMGFSVPIHAWFRADLADRYRELVLAPDASARDLVDRETAAGLLERHVAGAEDNGGILWALLMLEAWARTWLTRTADDADAAVPPTVAPSVHA